MEAVRRALFESDTLRIGLFEARPVSDACGEVERQDLNAVVLPFDGVFAKHEAPGRHVIGTPSHAVFFAAGVPYRLGFPGAIGDRALTLRFGDEVAPDRLDRRGGEPPASHGLLPALAMMLRQLLLARLREGEADEFEIEAAGLDLLDLTLVSLCAGANDAQRLPSARHIRAVGRVKEAVAQEPGERWTVAALASIANLSPFHLCRVFRQISGTSIYDYVLRERLAGVLDAVLDGGDLTMIALDAGFASHSHFTDRFRRFFGCTPTALRQAAKTRRAGEMRKIMTAPGGHALLN